MGLKSDESIKEFTHKYSKVCVDNNAIEPDLFDEYGVKRGLRDKNGKGVLSGLTNISLIKSSEEIDGKSVPCDGQLYYRGYNIFDLVRGFQKENRFGFDECAYLLLFGNLPTANELMEFKKTLGYSMTLPTNFVRDVIMKAPSHDIMNSLTKSVLTLASYDESVADMSLDNVLRQSLMLISVFPMLSVYGYHAYNHYECDESLYIHRPDPRLSTAENLLRMLRPDMSYTPTEAKVLDAALVLHMEHGGGNNSTFTTRVVTSAGSDTYSVIAAALSSLKGPKHGGANIIHFHKPLGGDPWLRHGVTALAGAHVVGQRLHLDKEAALFQVFYNLPAGVHPCHPGILTAVFVDGAVLVHHVDNGQVVALAHLKVVGVVGGGDFHHAGAEVHLHIFVRHNGDFFIHKGQDNIFAD